jgi:hypothetical protein
MIPAELSPQLSHKRLREKPKIRSMKMAIGDKRQPDYGLIVRTPQPMKATWNDRFWVAQLFWSLECKRKLTSPKEHVEQRVMLERKGVSVPRGQWIALSDPFTANPQLFKRAGNKAHSDEVLLTIQVTAALALDLAVSQNELPAVAAEKKISRGLGQAGLMSPGAHQAHYSHHAIKKWRDIHKRSEWFAKGLEIFRRQKLSWAEVLMLACMEARLRAELHKLHEDDPTGSKTHEEFERFKREVREEHERVQQEYFL